MSVICAGRLGAGNSDDQCAWPEIHSYPRHQGKEGRAQAFPVSITYLLFTVHMCTCTHALMDTCTREYTHAAHGHIYLLMYTCTHATHVHICLHMHTCNTCTHLLMYTCTHATHVHIYSCTHAQRLHMYTFTHVCMHTCTHPTQVHI